MVAAAFGLPETFFGDVSVGTLATATALNRPTELDMRSRQAFWKDILMDLLNYVLVWSVKAGTLKGKAELVKQPDGMEDLRWKDAKFQDVVEITFPPVVEPNKLTDVEAIVKAATLGGSINSGMIDDEQLLKMLLIALGEQDIEQIMEKMEEEPEFAKQVEVFLEKYFKPRKEND